jgi:hypothetical protein
MSTSHRRTFLGVIALAFAVTGASCKKDPTGVQGGPHTPSGHPVLFVGNSLTYTNNLPEIVARLATQAGDTIDAWSVAYPDYAIIDHIYDGGALSSIKSYKWEYVILQQGPSTVQVNRDSLILWTKMIDPAIRAQGAQTALYQVWPDASRMSFFDACRLSYQMAAQAVGGVFMPAGAAWQIAWGKDSDLPLYGGDGFHPSQLGTYLAALVIYERVTGRDARALPDVSIREGGGAISGVSAATVALLQDAAHEANQKYPAR